MTEAWEPFHVKPSYNWLIGTAEVEGLLNHEMIYQSFEDIRETSEKILEYF